MTAFEGSGEFGGYEAHDQPDISDADGSSYPVERQAVPAADADDPQADAVYQDDMGADAAWWQEILDGDTTAGEQAPKSLSPADASDIAVVPDEGYSQDGIGRDAVRILGGMTGLPRPENAEGPQADGVGDAVSDTPVPADTTAEDEILDGTVQRFADGRWQDIDVKPEDLSGDAVPDLTGIAPEMINAVPEGDEPAEADPRAADPGDVTPDTPPVQTGAGGSGRPPTDVPHTDFGEDDMPPPILPSTPQDVMWESRFGGSVDVMGSPDSPEAVKIYRRPNNEAQNILLTTPGGQQLVAAEKDIVMIYPRQADGTFAARPAEVFTAFAPPKGYLQTEYVSDEREAAVRGMEETFRAGATDELAVPLMDTGIKGKLLEWLAANVGAWRDMFRGKTQPAKDYLSLPPAQQLIHYSIGGKQVSAISPNGTLIQGGKYDIMQVGWLDEDWKYTVQRHVRLDDLADEKDYIRLQ